MKIKLTALVLGLVTFGLVSFAQENNNNPAPPEAPPSIAPPAPAPTPPPTEPAAPPPGTEPAAPPPATEPAAVPTPTPQPTPEQSAGGQQQPPAATPGAAGDVVPLIVIDDVPLTDAIRNLARQSNLNFQFDPKITASNQPNVSIRFENVTAQEALSAVLDNYNLVLVKDTKSKIARVTVKDPKAEDPLVAQIIQLKYSDPTNLITLVKSTLSARSTVVADTRTSQLIVNTTEKEMDGVVALIEKLDSPTKQVLIEAKLLETARNPSTVKGIDWSGTLEAQNFKFGNNALPGVPPQPATPPIPGPGGTIIPGIPATAGSIGGILSNPKLLANTANGLNPSTAFLNADGVSAVLSFLNKDSDTEVVATPRAVTLDNETATLSVTRAFPIFQITPGSANSPAGSQINYTNLGTILRVTPRIAADNNISLKIVPEVSNIDGKDSQTLNGALNIANIYAIRRIETRVMIPSGNTLVMGGLLNDTQTKSYIKVPLLGDLPGIGLAFRKESKTRNKANLLIFITPTIVNDEAFLSTSSGSEFLKTRVTEKPEPEETAWDSGKPHDWTKPVY